VTLLYGSYSRALSRVWLVKVKALVEMKVLVREDIPRKIEVKNQTHGRRS